MYILRDMTDLSYLKIAEFFGKKDHTTVIYAEEKIKNQIKEDIELKRIVAVSYTHLGEGRPP